MEALTVFVITNTPVLSSHRDLQPGLAKPTVTTSAMNAQNELSVHAAAAAVEDPATVIAPRYPKICSND